VLDEVMQDPAQPAAARIKAASELLSRASWSEAATQRERTQKAVQRELDAFVEVLAEGLDPDTFAELQRVAEAAGADSSELSEGATLEAAKARARVARETKGHRGCTH
jgi:acetyl-CoA carboxylase carboxyltransferase component